MSNTCVQILSKSLPFSFQNKMSCNHTGLITEFSVRPIYLSIGNETTLEYDVKIKPTTRDDVYTVICNNAGIGLTAEKAKEHVLLAMEIARASNYPSSYKITVYVPFFPKLVMPLSEIDKAVDIVTKALNMYF